MLPLARSHSLVASANRGIIRTWRNHPRQHDSIIARCLLLPLTAASRQVCYLARFCATMTRRPPWVLALMESACGELRSLASSITAHTIAPFLGSVTGQARPLLGIATLHPREKEPLALLLRAPGHDLTPALIVMTVRRHHRRGPLEMQDVHPRHTHPNCPSPSESSTRQVTPRVRPPLAQVPRLHLRNIKRMDGRLREQALALPGSRRQRQAESLLPKGWSRQTAATATAIIQGCRHTFLHPPQNSLQLCAALDPDSQFPSPAQPVLG